MDVTKTIFDEKSFDCVVERASLHHMKNWQSAIDVMFCLSKRFVFICEPLDDDRSIEKRNLNRAQNLYLEVQHEAGYEHYNHLEEKALRNYLDSKAIKYECLIQRFDDPIKFDEYFEAFGRFAGNTPRVDYWIKRLSDFKVSLSGGSLCANDVISIFCGLDY
jgi:hypothetical protein